MKKHEQVAELPAGFYGKIPAAGDFVSRRVSQNTIFIWDNWLRHSLYENKQLAGTRQPSDAQHRTDLWNFIVPTAICGEPMLGMIVPSRDRVGRQFPFTMFKPLSAISNRGMRLEQVSSFFADHQSIIGALLHRNLNITQLEQALAESGSVVAVTPLAKPDPLATLPSRDGDIFAVLNGNTLTPESNVAASNNCQLPWPGLDTAAVAAGSTSYWWSNQSSGGPMRAFTHNGGLNQTLFNSLFLSSVR